MKVFISGQKYYGEQVFFICRNLGLEIVGVSCPIGDRYIGKAAALFEVPIIPAGLLNGDTFPEGIDFGICAHSFDYVGKKTRYKPRLGWIGYHPSLLPRHRGRSAIEWAIRMRDPITGGSIYWLNAGIDRGDVLVQDWCFINPSLFAMEPKKAARRIWEDKLCPMAETLMEKAITMILDGTAPRIPQNPEYSTWEPSTEVKDIYRPDALMLPEHID